MRSCTKGARYQLGLATYRCTCPAPCLLAESCAATIPESLAVRHASLARIIQRHALSYYFVRVFRVCMGFRVRLAAFGTLVTRCLHRRLPKPSHVYHGLGSTTSCSLVRVAFFQARQSTCTNQHRAHSFREASSCTNMQRLQSKHGLPPNVLKGKVTIRQRLLAIHVQPINPVYLM